VRSAHGFLPATDRDVRTAHPTRLLILLALALAACSGRPGEQVETIAPVPVTTQAVRRGAIRRLIPATGIVKPAAGAELLVTVPQAARIAELPKGVGDHVRQGDLLARFEVPALESDAASRRADASRAAARLTLAKANFERVQGLFERGIAARKEVEDARRELSDAETGVRESKTSQESAAKLLGREVVRAPFGGVIAERSHNPGDMVDSAADVILRLIDPSRLQVEAAVPVDQLAGIEIGNPARVLGPGGAAFAAKVIARPPSVDPATSSANLRLGFLQPANLPSGTPVQAEISGEEHSNAVVAPAAAVVQEGAETFIYTVDGQGHAHRIAVRTGIAAGSEVEILSGLTDGAQVIVEGQNGLPDGAAVTLEKPKPDKAEPEKEP
jgi:RND family efflux transporter MFP subunit